jgi:hypothetical protein
VVDEVGLEPEFLPNLQTITAEGTANPFTSFTDTRQIVGRPVQFFGVTAVGVTVDVAVVSEFVGDMVLKNATTPTAARSSSPAGT